MITDDFKLFNEFDEFIFVTNPKGEILFQNIFAQRFFGRLKNFSKIKHYMESSTCVISTNRFSTSFIDLIFESKENFHAFCTFQTSNDEYYDFSVNSSRLGDYVFIRFKDVTQAVNSKAQNDRLETLQKKYDKLLETTDKLEKLKEHAQTHALQTALINRVFAKIRKSEDIADLIKSVISEVHELLGSYKTYFVVPGSKFHTIKLVNSQDYSSDINKKIILDDSTLKSVSNLKIRTAVCLKESLNSEQTLTKGTQRVVIPISDGKKPIGAIITLTVQSSAVKANTELLQTIAEQLTGAVIRTLLTDNIKKQNKKLRKTLKELEQTQLQLINSEKLASLGQLIAGVAHEINTPLGSINSNNEMVKKLAVKNTIADNSQIIQELNDIDSEAIRRISNIVKSLKKFVRLDEAELQPADINKELDLTLQLINHEIKNKITVIKNYAELPVINCYVNMLNQVFMNLLVNACHSITDKGEIKIKTQLKNKMLIVSIKDNGCGISEKNKDKVFMVGFTTKGIGAGTGLGLAISQKIVKKHKGTISFTSKEGKGTEFTVKIPCR